MLDECADARIVARIYHVMGTLLSLQPQEHLMPEFTSHNGKYNDVAVGAKEVWEWGGAWRLSCPVKQIRNMGNLSKKIAHKYVERVRDAS